MQLRTWKFIRHAAAVAACVSPVLAQDAPAAAAANGFRLFSVATSVGYSSGANDFLPVRTGASENDFMGSASATVGYTYAGARSRLLILYTPSYVRTWDNTLKADSHDFSISATGPLSSKWSASLTGTALETSLAQLLFEPTSLSQLVASQASGVGSSGIVLGQDPTLLLTDQLSRGLIYGDRIFSAGLRAGLAYHYSSRLQVRFSLGGMYGQSRTDRNFSASERQSLIPRSRSGEGSIGLSYAVTQRTTLGVNAETVRVWAGTSNYFVSHTSGSLSRQLTRRWSASLEAGSGVVTPVHQPNAGPVKPALTGSASTAYAYGSHMLLATYSRMAGDLYGFGATSTEGVSGTWSWQPPRRRWGLNLSAGREQIRRDIDIVSWQAAGSLNCRLSRETSLNFVYAYLSSRGSLTGTRTDLSGSSARISFVWTPLGRWATVAP
jgi:hypothetical protein